MIRQHVPKRIATWIALASFFLATTFLVCSGRWTWRQVSHTKKDNLSSIKSESLQSVIWVRNGGVELGDWGYGVPTTTFWSPPDNFGTQRWHWRWSFGGVQMMNYKATFLPVWPLVLACGVGAFWLWRRDPKWTAIGCCVHCGYDLRGVDRSDCPECGMAIKRKRIAPT